MNLLRLEAVIQQLARHFAPYLELGVAAADEYRGAVVRRLVLLLLAIPVALVGIAALWATGLVALWDTQWRLAYAAGSALVLLAAAAAALYGALGRRAPGHYGDLLRTEIRKDMELLREWKSSKSTL